MNLSVPAKTYIGITAAAGATVLVIGLSRWECQDPARFICYLLVTLLASQLKVSLPGITGTMSVNFLFVLIGIVELSFSETLVIGCAGTLLQSLWKAKKRPRPIQLLFTVSSIATAIAAAYLAFHLGTQWQVIQRFPLLLVAASVYFVMNTLPVAAIICLTERQKLWKIWRECYFWSFPCYLVGAAGAALIGVVNRNFGWQTALLVLPVGYWIYHSYRLYLQRLQDEKKHVEEMASLHMRTIEALAMAIEAKDQTTHDHLRRVQIYALEIGRDLGLSQAELEALRASALLHDIGKLAVPEHILSKPGRLTPEEFERLKIHPGVGADILERVEFPYPVAPIVRSHHERWDGKGYPAGLRGEEIPIGARILSVVDCLDALCSDRQYRRALPIHEAMKMVASGAGTQYDPRVVSVLERRYVELERMAQAQGNGKPGLSTDVKVERGDAPAAGFEKTDGQASPMDFISSIVSARQEAQALLELSQDLGSSLSLNETLSVLAIRLKRMIPYDSIAVYVRREERLIPEFVAGQDDALFSSLAIPVGHGLSGWVAENRLAIVNGSPSVEPGYLNDASKRSTLESALSVPLEGPNGVVAVLTLYHAEKDAFTKDHLRILQAIAVKIALTIENALKYREAESSATTDAMTGLPNARALFLHLEAEVSRCRRGKSIMAVLVCDLDGFKEINDRFGHLQGNQVLKDVGQELRDACRSYDCVARMGGDEFVLILPGQQPEELPAKIARLSEIVSNVGRRICGETNLSLSVGAAFYDADGTDAEQLLAKADQRMYAVKQAHKQAVRAPREAPSIMAAVATIQ